MSSPSLCGAWSVVGQTDDGVTIAHPLSCRSWLCSSCRKRNKRRLLWRLSTVKVTTLLTLTCRQRSHADPEAAFGTMTVAVNHLFKRIRRQWPGRSFEYFLVWERTKAGWPHAHLLLRAPYIPQRWLSKNWAVLTGATIVDIRSVNQPHHVASYLAKYLAKDPLCPAGFKRFRSSRKFFDGLVPAPPPGTQRVRHWTLVHADTHSIALDLAAHGLTVREDSDGRVVGAPPGHPSAPLFDSLSLHPEVTAPPVPLHGLHLLLDTF